MAQLTIKNLCKSFDLTLCLKNINLQISDGELIVVLGPSGCGKSTLLRLVAGLEKPDDGSIIIDGEPINDKEPKDRNVAMVFQYYALYPHLTVRQNMSLGLEHTTDLSKSDIRKTVKETTDLLKITKLLDRKPAQLSGGEAQRVAIGRALVRKPKIFLLDEPLSAVDTKLRRELRTEIKKLQRSIGVTTLYVTHDQEEAMAIGDRLVILKDGRIQQIGPPEDVYNHPKNKFVAGFLGKPAMNFLQAEVKSKDNKYYLENDTFSYEISSRFYFENLSNYVKRKVIVGVRPSVIKTVPTASRNTMAATVSFVENVGHENYIYLSINSMRLIAKASPDNIPRIGDKLNIAFEEDDLYLFDIETEESLRK